MVELDKIYQHYKGGFYKTIAVAMHTETEEEMVVYCCMKTGKNFARPISMWFEKVGGKLRFEIYYERESEKII